MLLLLYAYSQLKNELSEEFRHRQEMEEYAHEIDSVLGENEYYSRLFHERATEGWHESFLPRFCNLSSLWLALGNRPVSPSDFTAHEANCAFLDGTDNVFDAQAVHLYLACAYDRLGKEAECSHDFREALSLAERYDMLYSIAIMQYYYTGKSLSEALEPFPEEFQEKVREGNRLCHACHVKFANAMKINTMYKHLRGDDYLYLAFAAQGLTNKEVAARLHLSMGTVGKHYGEIYAEFGVKNKAEMIAYYNRLVKKTANP